MTALTRTVQLYGGPLDGEHRTVPANVEFLQFTGLNTEQPDSGDVATHQVMYVQSPDEPEVFVHVPGT